MAEGYFPLLSRGPIELRLQSDFEAGDPRPIGDLEERGYAQHVLCVLQGNNTAAGSRGARLEPGRAAWADRPIRPNEPLILQLELTPLHWRTSLSGPDPHPSDWEQRTAVLMQLNNVIFANARDSLCVLEFAAKNLGGRRLTALPVIATHFPFL